MTSDGLAYRLADTSRAPELKLDFETLMSHHFCLGGIGMRSLAAILAIALAVAVTACSEQIAAPSEPVVTFNANSFFYPRGLYSTPRNSAFPGRSWKFSIVLIVR